MSIRTVQFKVSANSVTPSFVQSGGIQGEHNATSIEFVLDSALMLKIQHEAGDNTPLYRIEAVNKAGVKISTPPEQLIFDTVEFALTNQLTQSGTDIKVYLVISVLEQGESLVDLYSFPAVLSLASLPDAKSAEQTEYNGLSELYKGAEQFALLAKMSAQRAENTKLSLENGAEFLFCGGDADSALDVGLTVDDTVSQFSPNPVKGSAIFEYIEDKLNSAKAQILLTAYPVGSYYRSEKNQNPSALFGGVWELFGSTDNEYCFIRKE